jgi:hypothetical protein
MAKDVYIGFRTTAEIRKTLQEMANEGFRTLMYIPHQTG